MARTILLDNLSPKLFAFPTIEPSKIKVTIKSRLLRGAVIEGIPEIAPFTALENCERKETIPRMKLVSVLPFQYDSWF